MVNLTRIHGQKKTALRLVPRALHLVSTQNTTLRSMILMCFPLTHSLYHVSGLGSSWHFSQTVKVSLCNRAFLLAVEYIVRLKTVCVTTKKESVISIMYAKKIKMKRGCDYSKNLLEIDSIYIESSTDSGFVEKEDLYDYLKGHPGSVQTFTRIPT